MLRHYCCYLCLLASGSQTAFPACSAKLSSKHRNSMSGWSIARCASRSGNASTNVLLFKWVVTNNLAGHLHVKIVTA